MILHIAATVLITLPLAFLAGAWWASRDSIAPADVDDLGDAYYTAVTSHTRATDALNASRARMDRLKGIAASQGSVKSGRIIAVLSGEGE